MTSGDLKARIADLLVTGFDLQPLWTCSRRASRRDQAGALSNGNLKQRARPSGLACFSVELPAIEHDASKSCRPAETADQPREARHAIWCDPKQ